MPLWCSGRGHGDALHLADYDPTHEGMEYFSVHEDYSGNAITGSTTGHNGEQQFRRNDALMPQIQARKCFIRTIMQIRVEV